MKKVSIVIPCYGTEAYVEKCIKSLFCQSYENIEIIAVNDCSKGNMSEILNNLSKKDKRLRVIENEKNMGLFFTRIAGSKEATGDYISFIDSDDYVDADYYRLLVNKAENEKCDVVIANYVRKNSFSEFVAGLSFNTNNATYDGKDFYDIYFAQTGRNIRNHMLCTKLIDMQIWNNVLKMVSTVKEKIVMTEDFAFSTVALFYAKKVGFCDNAIYYYFNNDNQSTSQKNISLEKINKNIFDIRTVFDFVKDFLKKQKIYEKYEKEFEIWRAFYLSMHINTYEDFKKKNKDVGNLDFDYQNDEGIKNFFLIRENDKSWDNYHGLITEFDSGLQQLKEMIMDEDIEIISFDLFDTLINRPFMVPSDMFILLNQLFIKEFNSIKTIDFARIRKKCESELREKNYKNKIQEVTLDGIYNYMAELYDLDKEKLNKIKKKEMELELHFCRRRESGYELYSLAKFINKKVILTSDIYLPKKLIESILKNNGYEFDEIYISSDILKTKENGSLFKYIIDQEKTKKILHIGDNFKGDYKKPQQYSLKSAQLYKAIDVMMGYTPKKVRNCGQLYKKFVSFNHDHVSYEETFGVRCSLAIVANYYFDNPFRAYNSYSDFNGDPYFIGYYALGMQTISLCKWLLEDAKNSKVDSISFMARDGYLPFKASSIVANEIKKYNDIKQNYIYVSRKSLMPLLLKDKTGLSLIDSYVNYDILTPKDIIKQLENVIKIDSQKEEELRKKFNFEQKFDNSTSFNCFLSNLYDKCFDKEKYNSYYKICKEYFDENFTGNCATFDIGYSGKPETIISSIIDKPIITYFIHTYNSSAFNNTNNCQSPLKTFYDYKPTLTGTIREIFISSTDPTCIGYEEKNGRVQPVFYEKENYTYFNIDMINKIQTGSLDFVSKFCNYFKEYMDLIDLNKYYMSIPLEYYYHYAQMEDRLPTKNLLFEDNVNHFVEINKYIFNRYKDYSAEYSLGVIPKVYEDETINKSLPKRRINRIFYYLLYDRKTLKNKLNKWTDKKKNQDELPQSRIKRIIYYIVFDRKTLKNKIIRKKG